MRWRLGIVVLVLLIGGAGGVLWYLSRLPEEPRAIRFVPPANIEAVKGVLCMLSAAERGYFVKSGRYAMEHELHAAVRDLPPLTKPGYHYTISVPSAERFLILATSYGPLGKHPVAVLAGPDGKVCTVTPTMPHPELSPPDPDFRPASLHKRGGWGDAGPIYDCTACK